MTFTDIEQNPELDEERAPRRRPAKKSRIQLSQRCAFCGQKLPYEAYKDSKNKWIEPDPDEVIQAHVMQRRCTVLEEIDPGRGEEIKERYRLWDSLSVRNTRPRQR